MVRLNQALESAIEDTTKVKTLLALGEYQLNRDFSTSESYFNKGLNIINGKDGKIYKDLRTALYVQLGVVHRRKADYPLAIEYYLKALKYYEQTKNLSKSGMCIIIRRWCIDIKKNTVNPFAIFKKRLHSKKKLTTPLERGWDTICLGCPIE